MTKIERLILDQDNIREQEIQERLEYLREQIEKECISYSEIAELQSLAEYIDDDVVLLEWAGVPENSCRRCGKDVTECNGCR